ncbi:MAG: hypothetical protein FWC51_01365 [Proteobacteria bacterium]|nr:hypothetical protein [Pseudomonadota bacterium]
MKINKTIIISGLIGLVIGAGIMGIVAGYQYRAKAAAQKTAATMQHSAEIMGRFIKGTPVCYDALKKLATGVKK